ncbi:MAG: hypothetical protein EBQ85_00835, partial [Proteobacteria bacterium]|nr:hypothetical protein [Pseudomonadota bacterium]
IALKLELGWRQWPLKRNRNLPCIYEFTQSIWHYPVLGPPTFYTTLFGTSPKVGAQSMESFTFLLP